MSIITNAYIRDSTLTEVVELLKFCILSRHSVCPVKKQKVTTMVPHPSLVKCRKEWPVGLVCVLDGGEIR